MATRSDTESSAGGSGPGDSSRWLSRRTSASLSHATHASGTTAASDRYASAPFLLQNRFSRAGPRSELVVVETPPGANRPPLRPQRFPQRLQLVPTPANTTTAAAAATVSPAAISGPPASRVLNAALLAQQATAASTPDARRPPWDPPHLTLPRDTSLTSDVIGSDSSAPYTTTAGRSMPYTWTDSYLDESPSTMKARWMQQQTFGPVLQSEGGGSSTVDSTPRVPCDADAVWGGVLARNDAAKNGRSGGESQERLADRPVSRNAPHAAARPRRYDIEVAERGGVGLGGGGRAERDARDNLSRSGGAAAHDVSSAAKALFRQDSDIADGSASEASTMIATVQQPRRAAQVVPVERLRQTPGPQPPSATSPPLTVPDVRKASFVPLSQHLLEKCSRPSPASREQFGPSELVSPSIGVHAIGTGTSRGSRPSSSNHSCADSDAIARNSADGDTSCPNLRTSRCGGPRGRILKPLYED